jgi:catechol 2,3-dioxygenase-like lactoylglutathione lyase family enzyme
VYGPLISSPHPEAHQRLLVDVFGMETAGRALLDPSGSGRLLGAECSTELRVLRTPGVEAGAVLCRFDSDAPEAAETVRDEASRIFRDAFRVIDFYVPDFAAALAHAERAGFPMQTKEASYETNEGAFREAHHLGVDHVVTAFLHGAADFFTDFAEVRDRVTSEPISISLPLSDAGPTLEWYREVFGWDVVYEYDFVDASFSELMGVDEEFRVRSSTVGPTRQQTYVNIVDYGLPSEVGGSLLARSVAPRRGLLGLVVLTDDLDCVLARAGEGTPVEVDLPPFGATRAAYVRAPFGAPHLVMERP